MIVVSVVTVVTVTGLVSTVVLPCWICIGMVFPNPGVAELSLLEGVPLLIFQHCRAATFPLNLSRERWPNTAA